MAKRLMVLAFVTFAATGHAITVECKKGVYGGISLPPAPPHVPTLWGKTIYSGVDFSLFENAISSHATLDGPGGGINEVDIVFVGLNPGSGVYNDYINTNAPTGTYTQQFWAWFSRPGVRFCLIPPDQACFFAPSTTVGSGCPHPLSGGTWGGPVGI